MDLFSCDRKPGDLVSHFAFLQETVQLSLNAFSALSNSELLVDKPRGTPNAFLPFGNSPRMGSKQRIVLLPLRLGGGPSPLTWREQIEEIGRSVGKNFPRLGLAAGHS